MAIPTFPASKVKPLRFRLQMTQQDLADAIGVARSLVAHWETERAIPSGPAAILLSQLEARASLEEKIPVHA